MADPVYESGAWIYKMLITFIVAAAAIGIVGLNIVNDLNTIEVQKQLVLSRILYSKDSFWVEENGVVKPGVIDQNKFTPGYFNSLFIYPHGYIGASISYTTIRFQGNDYTRPATQYTSDSLYIDEQFFRHIQAQVEGGVGKTGSLETHILPVAIKTNAGMERGFLQIRIAAPYTT
jgi:hypothetical protein